MLIKQTEKQSAANFCREYGIERGARLKRSGDDGGDVYTIRITAVGDTLVLAKVIEEDGKPCRCAESSFSFKYSSWFLLGAE